MWDVGLGRAGESNGGKMGTTVTEQQLKTRKIVKKNHIPPNKTSLLTHTYIYTNKNKGHVYKY